MASPGTLPSRFHQYCRTQALIGERDTVIAAVSGGADSMVLLDLLVREGDIAVVVAHFNHRLRGAESDADQALVADRARLYGVPFHAGGADTKAESHRRGCGVQEVARDLRYAFLKELRAALGAHRIATAHHADDNAETILLNFFRGAGVQGLGGIPVLRQEEGIVRPLLFAHREEIEQYARDEGIPFRTDSSNESDAYTRNALRHRVLPLLRELIGPSVVDTVNRSGEHLRAAAEFIAGETRAALEQCLRPGRPGEIRFSVGRLAALPPFLRWQVVLTAGEELHHAHVEDILGLLTGISGRRVVLPGDREAVRDREEIIIRPHEAGEEFSLAVEPGREYRMAGFRFASALVERAGQFPGSDRAIEYVDADTVAARPLTLRSWREGDAFIPLGMGSRKKLSDFFVDEKVPLREKHRTPILATDDGDIVWVCGRRIDDRFKISDSTRRVLRLEFSTTSDR
jgi:tRNA(Ile)-lysidine synthase